MKTKRLGNSDLSITPVGFGAWAIGGSGWEFGWGEQDDKAVAAIEGKNIHEPELMTAA
jgi:aryl-alcohol dehydrogenase-like predicted oxidoreductase